MPENETRALRWLIALAAMAAAVSIIPASLGRTVVDSPTTLDIGNQWIGFAGFVRRCYLAGRFPLWDPHDLCGAPFLAFAHTASLYPPTVLLRLAFVSYPVSAALDIFLHLGLAAFASFYFLRRDGSSNPAAFAGGLIYTFSGFVFANINFPPSLHTAAWLPVWYAGAFALLERPRLKDGALAALGLAAMIYGGDLEMVVFGGLGLAFAAGLKWRERSLGWRPAAALLLAFVAGLTLALPQLLPAIELQARSIRAGGALTPEISPLFLLLAPVMMGFPVQQPASLYPPNHGLDPWYLGLLPIILAAWALRSPRARRPLWVLPAAAVYFLLFYVSPMSRLFSRLPVLGELMVPFRMQPALWLFILLAVTRALDQWAGDENGSPADRILPHGRRGGIAMMLFAAATLASLFVFHQAVTARIVFALIISIVGLGALRSGSRMTAVLAHSRYRLAILLVGADLFLFALACLPMTDPATLAPDPRLTRLIENTAGRERYFIYAIRGIIDPALPYHLGLRLDADTIDSFTRVPPRDAALRLAALYPDLLRRENGRLRQYDQMILRNPLKIDQRRLDLLNDLNIGWLIGRFAWPLDTGPLRLKEVFSTPPGDPDPLFIYRNDDARPRARAWRAGETMAVPVLHPAPDEVRLGPHPADGWTVGLSESWYPGWRAFAADSGREEKITPDGLGLRRFRPISSAGTVMRFIPESFRVGLWAGLSAMLAALVLALSRLFLAPASTTEKRP